MTKISLRVYNQDIEGLIDQNRLDEAIAHCRHILKTFPKHLGTYRLLGKAYLEAKHHSEAMDILQRVLMAVPDDFVSHAGMSIINDNNGKLDEAIWHMERAFEAQPSNAAIQGELQRLYGRRDGVEPPKIRLTRGALAHMYVQGELYPQAIAEVRGVLAEEPDRTDMQVLLAQAYFHAGQKVEASEMCSTLLKKYPYCLDANRILADILPGTERAESTKTYRHRVNELDPYATFVTGSVFHSTEVPDSAINMERLEWKPGESVDMQTDWASSLGISLGGKREEKPVWLKAAEESGTSQESISGVSPEESSIPGWMRSVGWTEATGNAPEEAPSGSETKVGESESELAQAELPDWVKSIAPSEAPQAAESFISVMKPNEKSIGEASPTEELSDWLKSLQGQSQWSPEEEPDIASKEEKREEAPELLGNLEPVEVSPEAKPIDEGITSAPSDKQGEEEEEIPDWMKEYRSDKEDIEPIRATEEPVLAGTGEPTQEGTPDGLEKSPSVEEDTVEGAPVVGMPAGTPESIGNLGTAPGDVDSALAWLESLAAKQGAKSEELITQPEARLETPPEWVQQARSLSDEEKTSGKEGAFTHGAADATGAWFKRLENEKSSDTSDKFHEGIEERPAAKPVGEEQIDQEREIPKWLSNIEETPADNRAEEKDLIPSGEDETNAWLKSLEKEENLESSYESMGGGKKSMAGEQVSQAQNHQEEEIPAWFNDLGKTSPKSLAEEEEPSGEIPIIGLPAEEADIPAWLRELEVPPSAGSASTEEELPQGAKSESEEPELQPTSPSEWKPLEVLEIPESGEQVMPTDTSTAKVTETPLIPTPKRTAILPDSIEVVLDHAREELAHGHILSAVEEYSKLIKKGRMLDEVIHDLREAQYRYPVDVGIYQVLGDAYMRANRLQDALDAYTKAEELLR